MNRLGPVEWWCWMADFLSLHPLSTNSTELCQMGIVMVNFFFNIAVKGPAIWTICVSKIEW